MDGAIHEQRFDNGLRLLFEPMPWLPTLSVNLLMPFGATTDPIGAEGSANVLHDWMQRGAGERDSRALLGALEGLGVRQGGGAGREGSSLSYSALVDALPELLPLVADTVRAPRLPDEEFEPARALARQELESLADAPTQRLFDALMRRFVESGQGRSTYGTAEGLSALDPDGVRADMRGRVGPQGTVLAVAGGADWDTLRAAVEDAFGSWSGGHAPLPAVALTGPGLGHVDAESAQTQIGLAFPAPLPSDPELYTYDLALHVLSGSMGSRLFTEVREKRGLVYSVGAFYRAMRGFGYTLAYAGTTPDRAEETLHVLLGEFQRLREGVDADELQRARVGMLSSLVMQGESSGARAGRLASDVFIQGRARTLDEIREAVEAVTLEHLNAYLADTPMEEPTILTLGPKSVEGTVAA